MPDAALRMYQESEEDDESAVTGRVTENGWCIALKDDTAVLWRAHDNTTTPVPYSITLSAIASTAALIQPLPASAEALTLLAITDDGDVCCWSSSFTTTTATPIHQLSLARDETCTSAMLLPASHTAHNTTSIAVGTSQGRIILIQLDNTTKTSITPRVTHTAESPRKGSAVWCSLASVGRMFRWSKASGAHEYQASETEVVSLVWYHSAEDEGVFALTRDMLCQYSLAGDQPTLIFSSSLDDLAPDEYQVRLVSMTSSSNSLYILFNRSTNSTTDTTVTTHVAIYPTSPTSSPPLPNTATAVLPVPAAVAEGAVGLGVSERDGAVVVHVWSTTGVAVLNASNMYAAAGVFEFVAAGGVVLGGGMEVGRSLMRDSSGVLPAYDNARCLLLCAGYGVVEVSDNRQRQANVDDSLSSSVDGLSLQQRRADAESVEGVLSVAFYLHRHGQTLASKMRIADAWKHHLLPNSASSTTPVASTQLDTLLLQYTHTLLNTFTTAASTAAATTNLTPQLLLDDLTTKQQLLAGWMHFLHGVGLYGLVSVSGRAGLMTAGEQLAGLVGVRRLLNMFPDSRLKSDMEYVSARERVMLAVMAGCVQRRAGQAVVVAWDSDRSVSVSSVK